MFRLFVETIKLEIGNICLFTGKIIFFQPLALHTFDCKKMQDKEEMNALSFN